MFMSHYVGVAGHGPSIDSYSVYLLARLLGETVTEATGNKELCEKLDESDTTVSNM